MVIYLFSNSYFIIFTRYNVCLVGISTKETKYKKSIYTIDDDDESEEGESKSSETRLKFIDRNVVINPGSEYSLKPDDICLYISQIKEENYDWKMSKPYIGIYF